MKEKIKKILYFGGPLSPAADEPYPNENYEYGTGGGDWLTWLSWGLIIGIPLVYFLIRKLRARSKKRLIGR